MTHHASGKTILIGDSGVGKSCIFSQLTKDKFESDSKSTSDAHFAKKELEISPNNGQPDDKKVVRLNIWDTSGRHHSESPISKDCKDAAAVVIVFDLTNRKTFESIPYWLRELKSKVHPRATLYLVANKSDCIEDIAVQDDEIYNLVNRLGFDVKFFATEHGLIDEQGKLIFTKSSAKSTENIGTLFSVIAENIYELAMADDYDKDSELAVSRGPKYEPNKSPPQKTPLEKSNTELPPTLESYIQKRQLQGDGFGFYKKKAKLEAARYAESLPRTFSYTQLEVERKYLSDALLPAPYRGPLCEGSLAEAFAHALFQTKPFINDANILNIVKREFAIGLIEEYERKRRQGGISYFFSSKESLKNKLKTCEMLIQVLKNQLHLSSVVEFAERNTNTLNPKDDLGKLFAFLNERGCFNLTTRKVTPPQRAR